MITIKITVITHADSLQYPGCKCSSFSWLSPKTLLKNHHNDLELELNTSCPPLELNRKKSSVTKTTSNLSKCIKNEAGP